MLVVKEKCKTVPVWYEIPCVPQDVANQGVYTIKESRSTGIC